MSLYQCPICQLPLSSSTSSWYCLNNHVFDCAKEGYVNLMPVQHKNSKTPGDSKEMMQARRAFLDSGYYAPLKDKLCQVLIQNLPFQVSVILDIGCGEGYYTDAISSSVQTKLIKPEVYGIDIAKIAIKYAAKKYKKSHFCVASSHRLPFINNSIDVIVRIYAPCQAEEMNRVTTSEAIIVTVSPGARHLYQLKELIYDQVNLHSEPSELINGFDLQQQERLAYDMTLTGQQAFNLLQMTPFAWRTSNDVRQKLLTTTFFACETDFIINVYRKKIL